jgi:flagellar hook-basal body complex protein FliE
MSDAMMASIRAAAARIQVDAESIATPAVAQESPLAAGDGPGAGGFADSLRSVIREVDSQDRLAADKMAAVDAGRSDDLVGAMLASQQANLSFSMLMQTRNKVVGALDELIKLQL